MPDDKPAPFTLPKESLLDRAGTLLGATVTAFAGLTFLASLTLFSFSHVADFAFLAFMVALLGTLARHLIRIDRSEESDNFEEISLYDRWHLTVPRRVPPGKDQG
jgi:hypothetical protein